MRLPVILTAYSKSAKTNSRQNSVKRKKSTQFGSGDLEDALPI